MWAAFLFPFCEASSLGKCLAHFLPLERLLMLEHSRLLKSKNNLTKNLSLEFLKKKDLTEAQYYNMHHRKYPYGV